MTCGRGARRFSWKDDLVMTLYEEGGSLNGQRIVISTLNRKEMLLVTAAILFSHIMLRLLMILLPNTALSIPFITFVFYIAVLSPSMVIVLRERPIEGIRTALSYLTTTPIWSLAICVGLFLLHLGVGYLIKVSGSGDFVWVIEVIQALLMNAVILLFIFASASTLGLTAAFWLDKNRLN